MRKLDPVHWSEGVLPVLDFETTSADPEEARIVTAAVLLVGPNGEVLPGSDYVVVDVDGDIPEEAAAVHGVTTAMAREHGVTLEEALDRIGQVLTVAQMMGLPLLIYNALYDWRLLRYETERAGGAPPPDMPLIDPLVIDRKADRYRKGGRRLEKVAAHYGTPLDDAHNAVADCLATAGVCRAIFRKWPQLRGFSLDQLQDKQRQWHSEWVTNMNAFFAKVGREDRITDPDWPGTHADA